MDRLSNDQGRFGPARRLSTLGCAAIILALLHPQTALAQGVEEVNIFGEIQGGYTHLKPDDGGETSKNGYHLLLTAFAEITRSDWVWQAGGGLFYGRIYSDGEKDFPGSTEETVRKQKNLRIETRAGDIEFAGRYRLTGPWEAGLVVRTLFGTSLSFAQKKDERTKIFIGPQAVFRMDRDSDYLKRIDLSLTTDLNVPDRRVYLLTAGFALGRSFKFEKASETVTVLTSTPPDDRYEEILADKVINFPSGSSEVQGAALPFLRDLGDFLKANPTFWNTIEIEGHTDANGKLSYNMKLSKDRAAAVRQVLMNQGADGNKVTAEGYGPTKPLVKEDTAEARATNRRVVMAFSVSGREQRNSLSAKIKELRTKYFPE
ncbi:MAG: OmpA family protein [Bdellovibrionota bacterium]